MTSPSPSGPGSDLAYPPAPWRMVGQMWLTVFRLAEPVDDLRPAGIYGAAFVSYEAGSPLTYSELLVARPVSGQGRGRAVTITDIWVDSPASVAGGRALWAIPKELCDFTSDAATSGPVSRTTWEASSEGRPIARARFSDVSRLALRTPFRGSTWQPPIDDHSEPATAVLRGSAKALPCRGSWDLDPAGPLGWLAAARPVLSVRMAGFRMSFG